MSDRRVLPNEANNERLLAMKDRHAGERAFVLGNGPSLKIPDIDRLKGEVTFASNKIYLAFDQTDWRPTYLNCCDGKVAENLKLELTEYSWGQKVFGASVSEVLGDGNGFTYVNWPHPEGEANWDPVKGFRSGHSVVNLGIKLAYWMGITEIIVIGLDFHFDVPDTRTGEQVYGNDVIISRGEVNHFHPDYRKEGETWTVPQLDDQYRDFVFAREYLEARGRTIVNASRFTKLDAWPRVDFDQLLDS